MEKSFIVAVYLLLLTNIAHAQHFNARNAYIFDQKYVRRISTVNASELSGVSDLDAEFLSQYEKQGELADGVMPKGVKRIGNTLVLEAAGKPKLSLTDYIYSGKDDSGDSQRFAYLKELERFHVLTVLFDHDRPCFLLIEKKSLKIYFVDYAN